MTILVTGATGQLGRLVLDALLERGVEPATIVAGGRAVERLAPYAERGVQVRTLDYDAPETVTAAVVGVDTVLLVSGSEPGKRVPQHAAVIEAAKAAGVARIVYTSAPKADTSDLVLAPEHKATEVLIRDSGIPFTILRNNWYTENYVGQLAQAAETGTLLTSAGDGRVASASRRDFADATAVVLTTDGHEGATYELGGDVAWTFADLAAAFGEVLGRDVVLTQVSTDEHVAILEQAGLDAGTAGFVAALDGNIRDGALGDVTGELARLIGRPTTPLVEGLRAAR